MTRIPYATLLLSALFFAWGPYFAHAQQNAALYLEPATAVFPIGEPFDVQVRIRNSGGSIGTADATIGYEPQDLEFVSFSGDGSIFSSIIVPEQNEPGRVKIQGVVSYGRSYSGEDGTFVTLTFRPLRNTATEVRFMQGAATPLTAAVGAANVLSGLGAATYTLVPKESVPAAAIAYAAPVSGFEITPVPVPEGEYFASTSVTLAWTLPEGTTEMRTLVSDAPTDTPTKVYTIPVTTLTLDDLSEGTSYFHLQFKTSDEWGTVTHYPLKVDTTPPDYVVITEAERSDPSDPRAAFAIESADDQSGIDHFEMTIDNNDPVTWEKGTDGIFRPDVLDPGSHLLTAVAYDKAGNSASGELEFLVRSLDPPTLTEAPDHVLVGNQITVKGTTYPNAAVTAFVSFDDGEASEKKVQSDAAGAFVVNLTDTARAGKYTVWFSVADDRGAVSPPSIKRSVKATQPFIMLFGTIAVTYLSVIIPLIAMILLLALVLWLLFSWIKGYRARVRRETGQAYDVVQQEFAMLRQDLVRQIGILEQANHARKLTREELRIMTELREKLSDIEEHIEAEIDDIEPVAEHTRAVTDQPLERPSVLSTRASAAARPAKRSITVERA